MQPIQPAVSYRTAKSTHDVGFVARIDVILKRSNPRFLCLGRIPFFPSPDSSRVKTLTTCKLYRQVLCKWNLSFVQAKGWADKTWFFRVWKDFPHSCVLVCVCVCSCKREWMSKENESEVVGVKGFLLWAWMKFMSFLHEFMAARKTVAPRRKMHITKFLSNRCISTT